MKFRLSSFFCSELGKVFDFTPDQSMFRICFHLSTLTSPWSFTDPLVTTVCVVNLTVARVPAKHLPVQFDPRECLHPPFH